MKKIKLPSFRKRLNNKGQSFMELAIVMLLLISILFSMVEFGNLLNQYINLVDGSREGARYAVNTDPFTNANFFTNIDGIIEGKGLPGETTAIDPLKLNPATDDVVISYFSIVQGGAVTRFTPDWSKHGHTSQISTAEITASLNANAPSTGVLLVEIFYNYQQMFKFFPTNFFQVHAYSVMPLSAAEPTPTPDP